MALPKCKTVKIKVVGVPWIIKFYPSWMDVNPDFTSGERLYGVTIFDEHEIRIAGDAPVEKQHITVMHEIIHAITHEYGITPLEKDGGGHDEKHVDLLAIGIVEALSSMGMTLPSITVKGK